MAYPHTSSPDKTPFFSNRKIPRKLSSSPNTKSAMTCTPGGAVRPLMANLKLAHPQGHRQIVASAASSWGKNQSPR